MVVALPALGGDAVGSILSSLGNINMGDIASSLAIGALTTTAVAGAGTQAGQNALDPLHLFHKDGSQTVVGGKSISAAAFGALPAAAQDKLIAAGYSVAG